jgi:hypothetical protein
MFSVSRRLKRLLLVSGASLAGKAGKGQGASDGGKQFREAFEWKNAQMRSG